MLNPEASVLVRSYRRAIPAPVRTGVNRFIPRSWRRGVKSGLAGAQYGATYGLSHRIARRRNPEFFRVEGSLIVADRVWKRVAHVLPKPSPLAVRRGNMDRVIAALEVADIDYFAIRGLNDRKAVVGVSAEDGERACEALSLGLRKTGGYWSVLPRGRRRGPPDLNPGYQSISWSDVSGQVALQVTWFQTDQDTRLVYGTNYACEIEFWEQSGLTMTAPRRNRVTQEIPLTDPVADLSDSRFSRLAPDGLPAVRTRATLGARRPDDIHFPIDVVFTWVDGSDPAWQARHAAALGLGYHEESSNGSRYLNLDEVRFALRSIEMYAPWVRHIYLVTDDQRPAWLADAPDGLTVVDHREIFSDPSVLPNFNSHAIESQLHHIEGLSEHFLYLNDDMLFSSEVTPNAFFHANGLAKFFPSQAHVPTGPPDDTDEPSAIAGKNNRMVLEKRFNTTLTQKMKHAPYALRRSVLAEIEAEFEPEHRATMSNKVRDRTDLSVASSLHHFYGFQTGRSVQGNIRYRYVDLGKPNARRELNRLLAGRNYEAICLNSTVATDQITQEELFAFLDAYFPLPSRFER